MKLKDILEEIKRNERPCCWDLGSNGGFLRKGGNKTITEVGDDYVKFSCGVIIAISAISLIESDILY